MTLTIEHTVLAYDERGLSGRGSAKAWAGRTSGPSPATQAILTVLKVGESVFHTFYLQKPCLLHLEGHNHCFMHYFGVKTLSETLFSPPLMEPGYGARQGHPRAARRCDADERAQLAVRAASAHLPLPGTTVSCTILASKHCLRRFFPRL